MKTDLKVGDKLFAMIAPIHGRRSELYELDITKVGNKYYYAGTRNYKIDKTTLKCADGNYYPWNFQCYLTVKEIQDMLEAQKKRQDVNQAFTYGTIRATDEQIEAIHKILFPPHYENRSE